MRIPVVHCFDRNYVVPAAVSFLSMLEHADPRHQYALHVLHDDISDEDQATLTAMVERFPNASLRFVHMADRFADLFGRLAVKAHFSKAMFYKFVLADLLPDDDKIIVTDVDVVFLDDVSAEFVAFDTSEDVYFAGSRGLVRRGSWVDAYQRDYAHGFSPEERAALVTGAGYYLFNAAKLRADRMADAFVSFAHANAGRLRQPEQDTISILCHPKYRLLSARSMVCTYCYDFYQDDASLGEDVHYDAETVRDALKRPIQLHYATAVKPWSHPETTRADVWYHWLSRTPYAARHLASLGARLALSRAPTLAEVRLPFTRGRKRLVTKVVRT